MLLIFSFKHFIDWPDFYSRKSDQSFVSPALHHRKALFAGSALISACHVFLHSGGSLGPSVFVKKTRFKVPCISFWPPIQFFLERKWSSMLVLLYSVNALPYTPSCQVEIPQKFVPWRWIPTPSHPSAKYLLLFKLDSQFSWDCGSESTY